MIYNFPTSLGLGGIRQTSEMNEEKYQWFTPILRLTHFREEEEEKDDRFQDESLAEEEFQRWKNKENDADLALRLQFEFDRETDPRYFELVKAQSLERSHFFCRWEKWRQSPLLFELFETRAGSLCPSCEAPQSPSDGSAKF